MCLTLATRRGTTLHVLRAGPDHAAGLGVPSAVQTARSMESLCRGLQGVLGGSGGNSLDPSVWSVWPSGFLGSPGAGEAKAEVACRCFGCGRSRSSRCAPALLWGARFISRVASILIAAVWSQGGEGLGEQGLVGETLLHPVWVCPPLVVRSPVALGPRLLPNLPGGMFVREGLCIQVGRVRVRSLQPLRSEGLTPPLALI